MKTDMKLHTDVLAELAWDPGVNEKEIGVAVKDGVVTLTGSITSYADKWAAERTVERVAGVKAVANDLVVNLPSDFAHTDPEIAHRVVEALTWDVQVPSDGIKVAVEDGWVTLEGDVEWRYQRDAAAHAVRNIAGIRGVHNTITVTPQAASAEDVTRSITEALERRADRTAKRIIVESEGGVVTLTGSVPSFGERRAAEGAAWSAPGVTEVRDALAVVF